MIRVNNPYLHLDSEFLITQFPHGVGVMDSIYFKNRENLYEMFGQVFDDWCCSSQPNNTNYEYDFEEVFFFRSEDDALLFMLRFG